MIYAVPCMNGSTRAKNTSYRLIIIAPRFFLNLVQDFLTCWSRLKLTSLLLSSWNKTVPKFQCPFSVHPWLTYVKQKKRLKFSWSDFGRSMYNKNSQNMENRAKINGRIQNVQKLQIKNPKKLYFRLFQWFSYYSSQSSFKVAISTIPKSQKSLFAPIGGTSTFASDISMLYHFQMVRWFVAMSTVISVIFDSFFRQKLTFTVSSIGSVSWFDERCGNKNGCKKNNATDSHFKSLRILILISINDLVLYLINLPLQNLTLRVTKRI